jgi:hypothetical protein
MSNDFNHSRRRFLGDAAKTLDAAPNSRLAD